MGASFCYFYPFDKDILRRRLRQAVCANDTHVRVENVVQEFFHGDRGSLVDFVLVVAIEHRDDRVEVFINTLRVLVDFGVYLFLAVRLQAVTL